MGSRPRTICYKAYQVGSYELLMISHAQIPCLPVHLYKHHDTHANFVFRKSLYAQLLAIKACNELR